MATYRTVARSSTSRWKFEKSVDGDAFIVPATLVVNITTNNTIIEFQFNSPSTATLGPTSTEPEAGCTLLIQQMQ
jgi:hypothetical protein